MNAICERTGKRIYKRHQEADRVVGIAQKSSRGLTVAPISSYRCGHSGYGRVFFASADCILEMTDGQLAAPTFDQLVPIQPEGHQPSEFTTLADLLDSLKVSA